MGHFSAIEDRVLESMGLQRGQVCSPKQVELVKKTVLSLHNAEKAKFRQIRNIKSFKQLMSPALHEIARISESPIETQLFQALLGHDSLRDKIKLQHEVGPYRLDFALPCVKLAIEADGHQWHRADPGQIQRDQRRDAYLARLGWLTLRFTGSQIYKDGAECADRVYAFYNALRDA